MTEYWIVKATMAHVEELALTMRQADVVELDAEGYSPHEALVISVRNSLDAFTGLADGRVIAMFGHCSRGLMSDEAFPWLLSSQDMPRHAKAFLKLNRQYIAYLRDRYRLLSGRVCVTNTKSIRWLSWLGFTVDDPVIFVTPGKPGFHNFRMECP